MAAHLYFSALDVQFLTFEPTVDQCPVESEGEKKPVDVRSLLP